MRIIVAIQNFPSKPHKCPPEGCHLCRKARPGCRVWVHIDIITAPDWKPRNTVGNLYLCTLEVGHLFVHVSQCLFFTKKFLHGSIIYRVYPNICLHGWVRRLNIRTHTKTANESDILLFFGRIHVCHLYCKSRHTTCCYCLLHSQDFWSVSTWFTTMLGYGMIFMRSNLKQSENELPDISNFNSRTKVLMDLR